MTWKDDLNVVSKLCGRGIAAAANNVKTPDVERYLETLLRLESKLKFADQLADAIGDDLPAAPDDDMPCHYGICPKEQCGRCRRAAKVLTAHSAYLKDQTP